jgi:hypothetical protein
MRTLSFCAAALLLSTAACATAPSESGYGADMQRLTAECRERGGILINSGANTGRAEVDNACQIRGGSSDRLRND